MDALRDWAHRNRWVASFIERAKDRRRERAFSDALAATVGAAVRYRTPEDALASARDQVALLQAIEDPAPRKGSPSKVRIRAPDLETLAQALRSNASIGPRELRASERIASIDPAELSAFKLYLAIFWLANEPVIRSMRSIPREHIVLHMSCVSRLARAERSIESFPAGAAHTTHLKLVGTGTACTYDPATALLSVAAEDSYECLPQKVFQGLALLTLAHNPTTVVKLDDDHRLIDASELDKLLRFAAASSDALQLGEVNRTPSPSAHHRGWHFGKCAQGDLNERILEMPAPPKWTAGSSGYILNRAALWRILWASLYYRQWLEAVLYEDIALAEVANKTGIRIVNVRMTPAIGAISDY
jgi:hypothetical protein